MNKKIKVVIKSHPQNNHNKGATTVFDALKAKFIPNKLPTMAVDYAIQGIFTIWDIATTNKNHKALKSSCEKNADIYLVVISVTQKENMPKYKENKPILYIVNRSNEKYLDNKIAMPCFENPFHAKTFGSLLKDKILEINSTPVVNIQSDNNYFFKKAVKPAFYMGIAFIIAAFTFFLSGITIPSAPVLYVIGKISTGISLTSFITSAVCKYKVGS